MITDPSTWDLPAEPEPIKRSIIDVEDIATVLAQAPIIITLVLCFVVI